MNNEPVAWGMFKGDTFMDAIHPDEHKRFEGGYTIPLYTHPAELTDEEMLECAEGVGCVFDYSYKGEVTFISKNALKRFVLAILRKAQEK